MSKVLVNMAKDDNGDLILENALNTHNQQLETLRQRRSSLLNLTNINILLLSIIVGLTGVAIQSDITIDLFFIAPPILFVSFSALYGVKSFYSISEQWGYPLNRELVSRINDDPREKALEELVGKYSEANDFNKSSLERIQNKIFRMLTMMTITAGYLTGWLLFTQF